MQIPIITNGIVIPYLKEPGLSDSIVILPEVDTVNLTWMAGSERVSKPRLNTPPPPPPHNNVEPHTLKNHNAQINRTPL